MCGITGFLSRSTSTGGASATVVQAMADRLAHRGPDGSGVWVDDAAGIALGHRRLSILDLSEAGSQPMVSASGRYVLSFNGEIYNHLELRRQLESKGVQGWRGHSDTETLLESFDHRGIETTLKESVGMFAFALWDRHERVLTLARDRLGEKPLYYGWQGNAFLFGSELKALRAHGAFEGDIDRSQILSYLRFGYIPAPYSIYRDIYKLKAGCFLQIRESLDRGALPEPQEYWSLRRITESGYANAFAGTDDEAADELEQLLKEAVAVQRVADVPLGAFLSGGIDSSTIVALMQAQSSIPVRTFTIGSVNARRNEAEHAKAVARHLGTDHTEFYPTSRDALDLIPRLAELYDEPFGDSSAIPTYLVSRSARQHVTVALSGDGGDELFAGYHRYGRTIRLWERLSRVPRFGRLALARTVASISNASIFRTLGRSRSSIGERASKLSGYLVADEMEIFYRQQVSQWRNPSLLVRDAAERDSLFTDSREWLQAGQMYERMMYIDAMTYLPDDILVKVDRAAMGVSLEVRVPLLDHRIVEFACRLPLAMKVRGNERKWLLRRVLDRYVPRNLVERAKSGFGIPIDAWLRKELRDHAEGLLAPERMESEGFFVASAIRDHWQRFIAGDDQLSGPLWQVLIFQAWLDAEKNAKPR